MAEPSDPALTLSMDIGKETDNVDKAIRAAYQYVKGEEPRALKTEQIGSALLRPEALVWIGLHNPSAALIATFADQLGLDHELVADMTADHRAPRLADHDEQVMIVAQTVQLHSGQGRPHFGSVRYILGERFLLTIRTGPSLSHSQLRARLEKMRHRMERGCDQILTDLINGLLDQYNDVYRDFERRVDRTERSLLKGAMDSVTIQQLYMLRRDFHRFHNAIEPLGEVCSRLAQVKVRPVRGHAREHFLALSHRIQSMDRLFSNLSDDLSFAFEAGMLIEQARQTDTTRKLSAWAAIIAIPTAVAGIYGMNFENMPELKWTYGYYVVLGVMATSCATLYALFRRAKWL